MVNNEHVYDVGTLRRAFIHLNSSIAGITVKPVPIDIAYWIRVKGAVCIRGLKNGTDITANIRTNCDTTAYTSHLLETIPILNKECLSDRHSKQLKSSKEIKVAKTMLLAIFIPSPSFNAH
jgi:hypothetical protein